MAEQRSRQSRNGSGRTSPGRLSARQAVECVRRELPGLLGHPVDSMLEVEPDDGKVEWGVKVFTNVARAGGGIQRVDAGAGDAPGPPRTLYNSTSGLAAP